MDNDAVHLLKEKIRTEGRNLGRGILKVDSFLNHQVDAALMMAVGQELSARFDRTAPTKVLTAEISGIAPALMTAWALMVPVLYARKTRPITMPADAYCGEAPSHTKGNVVELVVSSEFLSPADRVLVIDDFLATGQTIRALTDIVQKSGATLVGVGTVVEKTFESGREALSDLDVPIESLVQITDMSGDRIVLAE